MNFDAFDTKKIDAYTEEAKRTWGKTEAYREYEEKSRSRTKEENETIADGLMKAIAEIGRLKDIPADDPEVRKRVEELRAYITKHYYTCTPEILKGLGQMYGAGGEMTENIDRYAGKGTAAFAAQAIAEYCKS